MQNQAVILRGVLEVRVLYHIQVRNLYARGIFREKAKHQSEGHGGVFELKGPNNRIPHAREDLDFRAQLPTSNETPRYR